jgi:hypothetical protein
MAFLRFLMLLALVVWIGGIIFFAFVEAPTLFHVRSTMSFLEKVILPNGMVTNDSWRGRELDDMIAQMIRQSLMRLHTIGFVSGIAFLICSFFHDRLSFARFKPYNASHCLIVIMLLLTSVSQFAILPRMKHIWVDMRNSSELILPNHPRRVEFDRLHAWSTRLEGGVLFLGLGVVILTARRFENRN